MFGRNKDDDVARTRATGSTATHVTAADAPQARGGVAFGPILTGVVVAFGAMFLLSAIVAGVLASLGLLDTNVTAGDVIEVGIGAGIALVIAQFLSYLWGGYTAGRMARGAGIANGLLVPLVAILVAILVGGIAAALGANTNLNLPFSTNQLPTENGNLVDWGVGIGVASLVAMFLGGAVGGGLGARWHSKLEHRVYDEEVSQRQVDLRERDTVRDRETTPAGVGATTGGAAASRRPAPAGTVDRPVDLSGDDHQSDQTRTYRR